MEIGNGPACSTFLNSKHPITKKDLRIWKKMYTHQNPTRPLSDGRVDRDLLKEGAAAFFVRVDILVRAAAAQFNSNYF